MSLERIRWLVTRFREKLSSPPDMAKARWTLAPELGRDLLQSMLLARHLDVAAHELREKGAGHYTICSSGHEANVVLGRLTRTSDPSLVHYRSAALQIERARQKPNIDVVRDIAVSLVASSEDPMSGGRHKVFGNAELGIIPQTSTIASHLPRAIGLAFGLDRRGRLGILDGVPRDAIAVVSFGDASINHSTALGAFNAASWVVHQNLPLGLVFVCEDNGLGISVRTPPGWVEERLKALPHLRYFSANGADLATTYQTAENAIRYARTQRRPSILHLRCTRLLGHAGSDVDTAYRTKAELELAAEQDPVFCAALSLVGSGALDAKEILELDTAAETRVRAEAERALTCPRIGTAAEVMSALASEVPGVLRKKPEQELTGSERLTLAQGINFALTEILEARPEALLFGEDIAKKGGVYGVTKGLFDRFGKVRVFNTLLDEQTILGIALGTATLGYLPIPEIQYLAYLHNAEDQLRGEAATMQFFSNGKYKNPMLVRVQGLAYQKGFGGHFHNDNSLAVLRDIPGIVVVVPARADDAIALFRTALELATRANRVVVFVEPIALYHRKDLYQDGDGEWLAGVPAARAPYEQVRVYRRDSNDLVIATYGNGLILSLRAALRLQREHGIFARVLDLRFIVPLPVRDVLGHARETGRLLIADECRRSGSVSEALAAAVLDAEIPICVARVTSKDSFIPLGDAASFVLLHENEIIEAARKLCARA